MSEPNHLPKANHLRFSFALIFIVVIGLSVIGVQKILQWKTDEDLATQREEHMARLARKSAAEELVQEARKELKPRPVVTRPRTPNVPIAPPPLPTPGEIVSSNQVNTPSPEVATSSSEAEVGTPVVATRPIGNPKSIWGRILLDGTPPPEKVIEPLLNDPTCGKLWTNTPMTRFYVTGAEGGLANTFVYIRSGLRGSKTYEPKGEALLDQVGCVYEPYVSGVMVNQRIKIRNSDAVLHNVHATPTSNAEFNFAQPMQGQVNEKTFSKPEVMVRFKCDVHPWMFAYVGVVGHPYFAVTDANGYFELKDVPDGSYEIEAVHQKAGRRTTTVVLQDGKLHKSPTIILSVPN